MEAVLQWGLDFIRLVQTSGYPPGYPPLTTFMRIITSLGSGAAYMILLPFIYWCVDEKKGLHLTAVMLFSLWLNLVLKFVLDQPRPFFEGFDPSVGMATENTGGLPSGHAQNSLVLWIIIASWTKRKLFYGVAAFFCLLVGFSRIYLGVHFPTDVLGGWLAGGLILCLYFLFGKRIETLLETIGTRAVGTRAVGTRAVMIAGAALSFIMILYRPSKVFLMPAGMILGLAAGFCLNRLFIGFTAASLFDRTGSAKYLTLAGRFALGIAGFILLYFVTGKLTAVFTGSENHDLFVFLRYALLALWISAGAPWLFRFTRLADRPDEQH
jgi:membrane-associated phospholipid phosphatase